MSQGTTVAVIDVGSNSIKLLIARKSADNQSVETVHKKILETRISAGISQKVPKLTQGAIEAGCQSISELVNLARDYTPEHIRIVATSAVRDAANGSDFIQKVKTITGIQVDILTGNEEATYIGKGLYCDPQIRNMEAFIQMDIGGGSMEFGRFLKETPQQVCSLQLGSVRLTEQFVNDRAAPLSPATEARIENHVRQAIEESEFVFGPGTLPFIATGGSFKVIHNLLAASKSMAAVIPPASVLQKKEVADLRSKLTRLTLQDRLILPEMPASRADILPTALITIDTVLEYAGCQTVILSTYNLRYGIAADSLGL